MWQGNPAYDVQVFNAAPSLDQTSNFLSKLDQQGDTNATASLSNDQGMVIEGPDSGPGLEQPSFHRPDIPMDGAEEEEEEEEGEEDMYGCVAEAEELGGGDQQMGTLPVNQEPMQLSRPWLTASRG